MDTTAPELSFPTLLSNPGLVERLAQLWVGDDQRPQTKTNKPPSREGKRRVRRYDNARFMGNPHIVAATAADFAIPPTPIKQTFPEPLPPYLPRTCRVPPATLPRCDPKSANAGRFSLSLKGMRRDLRKSGFRTESLVRDVEYEVLRWLQAGGILLNPDAERHSKLDCDSPRTPIGETETIFEMSRTPLQLVWSTDNDNFARYVVHCCARYHGIVSFSKDISGCRYTYLLRPNVTRPDHHAPGTLNTPQATDVSTDYSSHADTESDHGGRESDSDKESRSLPSSRQLPAISESYTPPMSPPDFSPPIVLDSLEQTGPIVNDLTDSEDYKSEADASLADSIGSLSTDIDHTPRAGLYRRQQAAVRRRVRTQRGRSPSSPSRSPARQSFRRVLPRTEKYWSHCNHHQSFYDYLFA